MDTNIEQAILKIAAIEGEGWFDVSLEEAQRRLEKFKKGKWIAAHHNKPAAPVTVEGRKFNYIIQGNWEVAVCRRGSRAIIEIL